MWQNFLISLEIMGKGMLGIFVVIGLLTLAVSVMGKLSHKEEKQERKN
ncbi:MAG: OadG family protein [Lachnospiraceae bacterium]|nr:OadG family protein [Lachnospiraceae bacterium]